MIGTANFVLPDGSLIIIYVCGRGHVARGRKRSGTRTLERDRKLTRWAWYVASKTTLGSKGHGVSITQKR